MTPYTVASVRSPELEVLESADPEQLSQATTSTVAQGLQEMMVETVDNGTAASAAISGIDVGGKTGTAQSTPDRPPYAWFTAFAPADDPQVAVAVLVESTSTTRSEISGGGLAGPIAKAVMEAVLG